MNPRKFALWGGIVMLAVGVVSLVPAFVGPTQGLPVLYLENSYGAFLGLFPMNIVNKLLLIAFGVAGIWASGLKYNSLPRSILYSRVVFVFMAIGTVLGLIPATNTFFGYWPLFGGEILMHGLFAVLGAYFGFALSARVPKQEAPHEFRTPLTGT